MYNTEFISKVLFEVGQMYILCVNPIQVPFKYPIVFKCHHMTLYQVKNIIDQSHVSLYSTWNNTYSVSIQRTRNRPNRFSLYFAIYFLQKALQPLLEICPKNWRYTMFQTKFCQ